MPASTNIEDRRSTPDLGYLPSRPHDLNWNSTNNYNKFDPGSFSRQFDAEQEARKWANANMPQTLSTAPLQDPNSSLDPSVMANVKAWQDRMFRAYPPGWQGPELPDGSQRGPQAIGTTLNYAPPGSL
jgi:hypothetical protein